MTRVRLINKNPDNAERFLQLAFAGIDQVTGRIPVGEVSLIDLERLTPEEIITDDVKKGENTWYFMTEANRKKLLNIDAIETYNLSKQLPQFEKE